MLDDLNRRLRALEERSKMRQGVVTATAPLSVTIGAASIAFTDCKRLASYTPVIGDTVRVEVTNGPPLILGKIV